MKFHTLKDCPAAESDFVCRESALLKSLVLITAIGGAVAIWFARADLLWLKIIVSCTCALFASFFGYALRATFDEQNWIVRLGNSGLRVKYRSYLNRHWPTDDVVIVQIDRREIEFVRAARERYVSHTNSDGTRITWLSYLDLKLRDEVDLSELKRRLAEERDRRAPAGKSKFHDVPVHVVDEHIVRIEWTSSSHRTTPRLATAVERVGSLAPIAPPLKFITDLRVSPTEARQREDLILQFIERGDTIQAIKEARRLYGYPLAEAKQFVDELSGRRAGNRVRQVERSA
jgi:hypothetical protein